MKFQMDGQEARRILAIGLEDCIRKGMGIEASIESTSVRYGVTSETLKSLLLSKLVGLSIHEAMRSGMKPEQAVTYSLRRFSVETTPEQKIGLVRMIDMEQERINTRLAGHEADDGMGGTMTLTDEAGNPLNKKDLQVKKN